MQSVLLVESLTSGCSLPPRGREAYRNIRLGPRKYRPLAIAMARRTPIGLTSGIARGLRPKGGNGEGSAMTKAHLDRRQALQAFTALGLASAFAPRVAWAQDKKLLRVRSYSDAQVSDP